MSEKHLPFRPTEILMPEKNIPLETWACVACDQYTSQPEYWERVEEIVGDHPSTLRLMLPECYLADSEARVPKIHAAMAEYLEKGLLYPAVQNGFVFCRRTTAAGTRIGLVGAVDLEEYDYSSGSSPLIRPTEQTIAERLPPRLKIRRGAPVELSHILILIDDPERTVLEPLNARAEAFRKLYDFDLMQGGGHLAGYAVDSAEDVQAVAELTKTVKPEWFGGKADSEAVRRLLTNSTLFGTDLVKAGLADIIEADLAEMLSGKGAVKKALSEAVR